MNDTCFTIGHSSHSQSTFLRLLTMHHIRCVVDIRSMPYSKYVPHFNKAHLEQFLRAHSIRYIYLGDALGGKRFEASGASGCALDTPAITAGIDRLKGIIRTEMPTVIVCAEADPARCHRGRYVTPLLKGRGIEVMHILPSGELFAAG